VLTGHPAAHHAARTIASGHLRSLGIEEIN